MDKEKTWKALLAKSKKDKDCIIWTGKTRDTGFGYYNDKFVHRLSYWIHNEKYENYKDIPAKSHDNKSLYLTHKCDNLLCMNKDHIYLAYANTKDEYIIPEEVTELSTEKNTEWTTEMYDIGKRKIEQYSKYEDEPSSELVDTPCRIWSGQLDSAKEHGQIQALGKKKKVHIFVCEVKNDYKNPDKLSTIQICGNKLCCAPEHLEFAKRSKNPKYTQSNIKLSEQAIKEIFENKDGLTLLQLSHKYDCGKTTIHNILNKKSQYMHYIQYM